MTVSNPKVRGVRLFVLRRIFGQAKIAGRQSDQVAV
jgi:hypothetical protein